MAIDEVTAARIVAELRPLIGGRIQRADVVAPHEIVLELRCPGRTIRLLLAAHPVLGRLHLVDRRPPRSAPGGDLQAILRKRLGGRPLTGIELLSERTVAIDVPDARLLVRLSGGKDAIGVELASRDIAAEVPRSAVQARGEMVLEHPLPERFPVSEEVAARFSAATDREVEQRLKTALLAPIRAELRKTKRLLANLDADRARLEVLAGEGRWGELLKTVLGRVKRGQREAEVVDYATGETVKVPLDPAIDVKANLERYFARAKKAHRGLPRVEERRAAVALRIADLEARRARIDAASFEELQELSRTAIADEGGVPRAARGGKERVAPIDRWSRRFTTAAGDEVRVGKGASENDRLTFSAARGHDIWLHARGVPGAHVLLRMEKGASPNQESLLDAAHLAAHYSDARGEPKVDVIYTQARNVRKTKGAPAGQVGVAHEKTMLLRVDPARLERLLATKR